MPSTVGYGDRGVGGVSPRRSRTIVGTTLNKNLNKTNQKQRGKGWVEPGVVRTEFVGIVERVSERRLVRWIGSISVDEENGDNEKPLSRFAFPRPIVRLMCLTVTIAILRNKGLGRFYILICHRFVLPSKMNENVCDGSDFEGF